LIDNNLTIEFKDIEIENIDDLKRRPKINILNDEVSKLMNNYNIDISISHVKENAIAMCVVSLKE
jgi:phosphopantetheinyl transferase (holo-ACP synthase)